MANIIWKLLGLISILEVADNLVNCVDGPSQAFIQVDNELTYLVDGVPIPMPLHMNDIIKTGEDIRYGDPDERGIPSKNYIIFDPPHLDFKQHPTGMPLMRKVLVQNTSPDTIIQLHSLSGNTLHFHCTFFQDKVVSPGGNTSFDVVFLGREEGLIENTIFIHTSVGTYKYGVRAIGTGNPYRLRPLVGVRMPLNSSYSPFITLHNPHPHPLQVTEIYSTGGDLHLELLDGAPEGLKPHWKVDPFSTQKLIKANFVARRENNHTAYVRIVTTDPDGGYLVVPVEVEVTSSPGLFFPQDGLHFGIVTPNVPPVSLPLHLLNSAHKHIHIQNVITTPVNDAIIIDFKPLKIPPGTVKPTKVATVTVDPSKLQNGKKISGKILIKSKVSAYKLTVPYTVDLYQGALTYNSSVTRFYTGQASDNSNTTSDENKSCSSDACPESGLSNTSIVPEERSLHLTNTFPCPVAVRNFYCLENASQHFQIKFSDPVVIPEGESVEVAKIRFLSAGSDLRINTTLIIVSNITDVYIPLLSYNGKLTKHIPPSGNENWIDFGTLGMGEQRDRYFYIINENPVELRLQGWGTTLPFGTVELMSIEQMWNVSSLKTHYNASYSNNKSLYLKPNHYAVFRIGILTPEREKMFIAEAMVRTQHENILIPFKLRTADGTIKVVPSNLIFNNSFPGKISYKDLYISSTFGHMMQVKDVRPQVEDARFTYTIEEGQHTIHPDLKPEMTENYIGRLNFNPKIECDKDCYTGFSLQSKSGQQWLNTLSLTSHVADTDLSLLTTLQSRFNDLSSRTFNTSIVLDTSEVQGFLFNAQVELTWPQLVEQRVATFPLTQVMNTSMLTLYIENPSNEPVLTQLLFLHHYPATQPLLSFIHQQLPTGFTEPSDESQISGSSDIFTFIDHDYLAGGGGAQAIGSSVPPHIPPDPLLTSGHAQHRKAIETQFKTRVSKDSIVLLLEPNVKVPIRIAFNPPDESDHSAVMLVRNNLTVIDVATFLYGRGGRGYLKFGSRKPGSAMPLTFSIGQKHLKDCDNPKNSKASRPNFTVKRSFTARNTGELPVEIWGFFIGDSPCQGYGFKVLDCEGFTLAPNDSRKVDVAFTPDFTLSKIMQPLVIHTSLGPVVDEDGTTTSGLLEYALVATVPPHLLAQCASAVPRPTWEPLVYYTIITILLTMLFGIFVLAMLDSEHILKTTFVTMTTSIPVDEPVPSFDKTKVFNLRTIGSDSRIKNGFICGGGDYETKSSRKGSISNTNSKTKTFQQQFSNNKSKSKDSDDWNSSRDGEDYHNLSLSNYIPTDNKTKSNKSQKYNVKKSIGLIEFLSRAMGKGDEDAVDNTATSMENKSYNKNDNTFRKDSLIDQYDSKTKRKNKQLSEEETSSTTTESSNTDELSINEADSNSHKASNEASSRHTSKNNKKRNKNKSQLNSRLTHNQRSQSVSSPADSEGLFEITTKIKGIKKIKEVSDHSDYYSTSLELPYVVKHPKSKDGDANKENKRIKNKYIKNTESCDSMGSSRSSPAGSWEDSHRSSTDSHNSPLSTSTTSHQIRHSSEHQPLAPRVSYSSILLGDKQKAKVAPIGKIIPEIKRVEKTLGPIGQKMGSNSTCPGSSSYNSQLNMSNNPLVSQMHNSNSLFQSGDSIHNSYFIGGLGGTQPILGQSQALNVHSWDPKTLNPHMRPPPGMSHKQEQQYVPINNPDDEWSRLNSSSVWQDNSMYSVNKPSSSQAQNQFSYDIWSSSWQSNPNQLLQSDTNNMSLWNNTNNNNNNNNNNSNNNNNHLHNNGVSDTLWFDPFRSISAIWHPSSQSEERSSDSWAGHGKKEDI